MKRELKALLNKAGGTCALVAELADVIDELNGTEWEETPIQTEIAAALRIVVAEHVDAEEETF